MVRMHEQADSRALCTINLDIGKRWRANQVNARWRQETTRNGNRFYGLIQSPRAHSLQFDRSLFSNDACYGSGYSVGLAFGRYAQCLHGAPLV